MANDNGFTFSIQALEKGHMSAKELRVLAGQNTSVADGQPNITYEGPVPTQYSGNDAEQIKKTINNYIKYGGTVQLAEKSISPELTNEAKGVVVTKAGDGKKTIDTDKLPDLNDHADILLATFKAFAESGITTSRKKELEALDAGYKDAAIQFTKNGGAIIGDDTGKSITVDSKGKPVNSRQ
jgi:hypothetical protein